MPGIRVAVVVACVLCCGMSGLAQGGDKAYEFAAKPSVTKDGEKWTIAFAPKTACDATVAVLDKDGKVVRHLASGVLGANAPAPFQKGSLVQRLEWDGKDDAGVPVPDGCRVKVSLGLRAEFARMLCTAPEGVGSRGPIALAVDREGVLYVTEGSLFTGHVTTIVTIQALDGEGKYLRFVVPFRADCPPEKVSMVEFITTVDGRRVPLSGPNNHRPYSGFVPGNPRMTRHIPAITKEGRLFFPCGEPVAGARRILSVGTDGSSPRELYIGPELPPGSRSGVATFLALSPDDKFLYVGGIATAKGPSHAVYRVSLVDKNARMEPFLGVESQSGADEKHLNDPRGVATDSAGRVYVGDYMNDRLQVFKPDGKLVKSIAIKGPEQVRVHPGTGAIYVLSVRDRGTTERYGNEVTWEVFGDKSLIKYASLDDPKPVAQIDLPKRRRHMHDVGPIVALDSTRAEPVLWIANVGRQEPEDMLWKVIDRGDRLERVEHKVLRFDRRGQTISPPLAADRRNNEVYALHTPEGSVRIDPVTGRTTKVELAGEVGKAALAAAGSAAVGPDGMLYLRSVQAAGERQVFWLIRRFNRKGELVPFAAAGEFIQTNGRRQVGSPESATAFSVGPDGKLYVVGGISKQELACRLDLYDADGTLLKAGLVALTNTTGGCVRVDVAGRLYLADTLRPRDREFPEVFPADPRQHLGKWYGTVLRFPPVGGSVRPSERTALTHFARGNAPVKVEGALWGFYGVSPMPQQAGCQCVIADFDVDDWGRVFVPDVPGCCVAVLDCAGNVVMRFGSYGNRDALGAGSTVPEPPIPLWFPERVAALDNDAFVVDSHNKRIVHVRLASAVEELVPVP